MDSPFNLTCSAEANPPASYRFYRDETSLDTSAVEVYKTLVSEKRSPLNYSCTPFNEYGEGPTGRITVKVHCKYSYPQLSVNMSKKDTVSYGCIKYIKFCLNILLIPRNKGRPNKWRYFTLLPKMTKWHSVFLSHLYSWPPAVEDHGICILEPMARIQPQHSKYSSNIGKQRPKA